LRGLAGGLGHQVTQADVEAVAKTPARDYPTVASNRPVVRELGFVLTLAAGGVKSNGVLFTYSLVCDMHTLPDEHGDIVWVLLYELVVAIDEYAAYDTLEHAVVPTAS
jgi:hypothetical protein